MNCPNGTSANFKVEAHSWYIWLEFELCRPRCEATYDMYSCSCKWIPFGLLKLFFLNSESVLLLLSFMSSFLIKHYFWRGENYRVAYSYTVMADQEDIPFRVCFEPLFPHKPVKKFFDREEMVFTFKSFPWIAEGLVGGAYSNGKKVVIRRPQWPFYDCHIYPVAESASFKRATFTQFSTQLFRLLGQVLIPHFYVRNFLTLMLSNSLPIVALTSTIYRVTW